MSTTLATPGFTLLPPAASDAAANPYLFVWMVGYTEPAAIQGLYLIPLLQRYGRVLVVEHPLDPGYTIGRTARIIADYIRNVMAADSLEGSATQVILVGSSMSGEVALQLRLALTGVSSVNPNPVKAMIIPCGVSGADSIKLPIRQLAKILRWPLTARPFFPWLLHASNRLGDFVGPGVKFEPDCRSSGPRMAYLSCMAWFPAPVRLAMTKELARLDRVQPGSHRECTIVYLQTTDDALVKSFAAQDYAQAGGPASVIMGVESRHNSFLGYPNAWEKAMVATLQYLGIHQPSK